MLPILKFLNFHWEDDTGQEGTADKCMEINRKEKNKKQENKITLRSKLKVKSSILIPHVWDGPQVRSKLVNTSYDYGAPCQSYSPL